MVAASLVVGVENYTELHYRESHNRLKYAVGDAQAFDAYVRAAWGTNSAAHHHLLTDEHATAAALELAAARLAGLGPLDLLLVYLSGHGDRGGDGHGWFCLADARPGAPSLDAARLDRLLRPIEAATALLFVDCCYAEAVVAGCTFFNALGTSRARVFICSARADQRAWEEDELEQSVFSHLLLRALSTDSRIARADGHVDLEGALFPHLGEQVPLRVLAKKRGQAQEPVKGGLSCAFIKLPTVTAQAMGRELSVLETVRARVRRILAIGTVAALVVLGVLDLTVYHFAVAPMGGIEVRPGPRALFGVLPLHLSRPVDTGIMTTDLDLAQNEDIEQLATGALWGLSSRRDPDGMRAWLTQLLPLLSRPAAWEASMLTAARPPEDGTRLDPEEDPPPIETFFFLWALEEGARGIADRFYAVPYNLSVGCTDAATANLDFVVLNPPADLFARDLLWLAATGPEAPAERVDLIEDLVALTGYRMVHADGEALGAEFEAFAGSVLLIAGLGERDMPVLSVGKAGQFLAMADSWCRAPALLALGLLGDDTARRHAEAAFLETIRRYDPRHQGDLLSPVQETALHALTVLAERHTLATETVRGVFNFIAADERGLESVPTLVDWLAAVAKHQPLPEETVEYLFFELDRQPGPYDFFPLVAFQMLARSSQFLDREQVDHLFTWLEAHGEDHRRQVALADGLGHLAATRPLDRKWVQLLAERIEPDVYLPSAETTARGTLAIRSTDGPAGVALGRIGQHQELEKELVDLLARFALARPDVEGRREVLSGVAAQDYCSGADTAACLHMMLLEARASSARRSLEIDVGVERILAEAPPRQDEILHGLRDRWAREPEPEIRMALARLIGRALLASSLDRAHPRS